MKRFLLLALLAAIPVSAAAQDDDKAYCAKLGALATRWIGSAGGDGRMAPDLNVLGAVISGHPDMNAEAALQVLTSDGAAAFTQRHPDSPMVDYYSCLTLYPNPSNLANMALAGTPSGKAPSGSRTGTVA